MSRKWSWYLNLYREIVKSRSQRSSKRRRLSGASCLSSSRSSVLLWSAIRETLSSLIKMRGCKLFLRQQILQFAKLNYFRLRTFSSAGWDLCSRQQTRGTSDHSGMWSQLGPVSTLNNTSCIVIVPSTMTSRVDFWNWRRSPRHPKVHFESLVCWFLDQ